MLLAYLGFAEGYYRKDGQTTREIANIKDAIRLFRRLYGHTQAAKFGPLALNPVRQAMIEAGLCRNEVNKRIGKFRRIFKWAASKELIPAAIFRWVADCRGPQEGPQYRPRVPTGQTGGGCGRAGDPAHVSRQVRAMIAL